MTAPAPRKRPEVGEVAEAEVEVNRPTGSASARVHQDRPVRLDETVEEIIDRLSNERRRS